MALKTLVLEKPEFNSNGRNIIIQDDVINCVKNNKNVNIIYLDPPYNSRQYASNFHVLESIVVYDKQPLKGKSGLRDYEDQRSNYCLKSKVYQELDELISNCDCNYILMSYSTEGLLTEEEILSILRKRGKCTVYKQEYRRFKTNSWTSASTNLNELLFVCNVGNYSKPPAELVVCTSPRRA